MDFRKLSTRAKQLVDKRGGAEALKQDAEQLREIAKGKGTLQDKAKRAAQALKEPGAREGQGGAGAPGTPAAGHEGPPEAPGSGAAGEQSTPPPPPAAGPPPPRT